MDHSSAPSAILQARGLCFSYPQRPLFADLSFDLAPGVTLVRGGDGCGKTALLRLLAGELAADAGQLQIGGVRFDAEPPAYRQQVFWLDPRTDAFDQMTAAGYFDSLRARYPRFDAQALGRLVDGLALAPHLDKGLYMLSTGSKRKVWLAAAWASGAAVVLLDEPFAALDKASAGFVAGLLAQEAGQTARAWVLADYVAPAQVPLAASIDLGD
ncbi:ABC transporter ATP-binding protein [Janthinobacterium fluminis]|uniref:ATP-binding cassette domain-containing protein n=1 Tax=Janthinobacterium fluminis TaxID=2987524 RepID=A0ABT5K6F3_9BURK|nr:ATP-binding cassette domain-containing protein [Janthinobacterium fluminis]MDC8759988.1 ATP-binding cassette domain-containing protein [Janthinobacterium fluminis]